MRRADRLFQIIQLLRRRHVLTAGAIAGELEVSERTVYRDIADLVRSGVPIAGEAGVGYTLRRGFDLPPLMFTEEEIEALVLGTRVVSSWADDDLAKAAESALARIEAALPDKLKARLTGSRLFAPAFHVPQGVAAALADLRHAIDGHRKTELAYMDGDGAESNRTVRPLGLFFWGNKWTLTAWCELRDDFRDFRLDRIQGMTMLDGTFEPEAGKTIEDFFSRWEEHE
jgi:predicted DNA-binding transcriptional regulator YafY